MGDQGPAVGGLELPAPQVPGRGLSLGRWQPGDRAALGEVDDVVLTHPATQVGHREDVADGAHALAGLRLGEVVVAVPARLLRGVGDQVEEDRSRGGDLPGGGDEALRVLAHGSMVPPEGAVSSKTSIEPV